MTATYELFAMCDSCGSLMRVEIVVTEWGDGQPKRWENRCECCGRVLGFGIDSGEVELP